MKRKYDLIVCTICGAVIFATGVTTFIIARGLLPVLFAVFGLLVIAAGITYYFIAVKKDSAAPVYDKAHTERAEHYMELYSYFAYAAERKNIFLKKAAKLKDGLLKIDNLKSDGDERAFALYLYYIYDMDKRFSSYPAQKVTSRLEEMLGGENFEVTLDNLPEGLTLCDLVERALTQDDKLK